MRNKQIIQNRLGKLNGLIQKQDMNVNRGGTREQYNETHRSIKEVLQDIMDIIERES
jgi:predicted transcriptional regulator